MGSSLAGLLWEMGLSGLCEQCLHVAAAAAKCGVLRVVKLLVSHKMSREAQGAA